MPIGVLVTGAAGFIGEHASVRLRQAGFAVRAVDAFRVPERNVPAARRLGRYGIDVQPLDLASAALGPLLEGVHRVIHLAARPGVRDRDSAAIAHDNILGLERLLGALSRVPSTQLIFASSSSVTSSAGSESDGPLSYARSKLLGEEMVQAASVDYTILRLFSVYGPGQRPDMAIASACRAAAHATEFEVRGDGRQLRDWTYVGDVVRALQSAVHAPAGSFDIGTGSPVSLDSALNAVEQIAGCPVRRRYIAPDPLDAPMTCADRDRNGGLGGWAPRVALAEGIAEQWRSATERDYAATDDASRRSIPWPASARESISRATWSGVR